MEKQKSLTLGYLLALFLGGIGAHLFYVGKYKRGIVYLLFCWTYIPILLGWFDMLFMRKWIGEPRSIKPLIERIEQRDKGIENTQIKIKQREKSIESTHVNHFDNEKFYNEEDVILSKYAHLRTPKYVLEELDSLQYPRKNTINTKYGDISFEVSMSTSYTNFLKESINYANKKGTSCEYQPLQVYWTTYSDLNEKQKKWYFYWREQAIKGNYLNTDLSYIILFIYELLNYSFNRNAAFNASMMELLHMNYIERDPKLGNYLSRWLADFLLELNEEELAKEWDRNEAYNRSQFYMQLKEKENELEKISISQWKPYIRNYRSTEFFEKNKNKIYKVFKESFPLVKQAYEAKGEDLFDDWFKFVKGKENRHLFASAVMGRKKREYFIETEEYIPTERMFNEISNLFRLAENVTRTTMGEKRQIKVNEEMLPEGLKEVVMNRFNNQKADAAVNSRFKKVQDKRNDVMGSEIPPRQEETKPEEKQAITFDFERIQQLKQESDSLQAVFEERFSDDEVIVENAPPEIQKVKDEEIEQEDINLFPEQEDEDDSAFIESLTELEIEFLLGFTDGRRDVSDSYQFIKNKGVMPGSFLSTLNEKAMEHLNDTLIETDGEEYEIYDEFIYILKKVKEVA